VRIHQKDLAVTDHATALPERKRAAAVVLFVCDVSKDVERDGLDLAPHGETVQ